MLRKLFSILAILLVSGHSLASNFVIGNMCFEVLDENDHTASLAVCWDKGETVIDAKWILYLDIPLNNPSLYHLPTTLE